MGISERFYLQLKEKRSSEHNRYSWVVLIYALIWCQCLQEYAQHNCFGTAQGMDKPIEFGFLEQQQKKKNRPDREESNFRAFSRGLLGTQSRKRTDMWKNSVGPIFAIICLRTLLNLTILAFTTVPSFFNHYSPYSDLKKTFCPVPEFLKSGGREAGCFYCIFSCVLQHPLFLTVTSKQLQFFASTVA